MSRTGHIWPVLLAAGVALAILVTLGVWQVKRLAWKEELIAQLAAKAVAEPVDVGKAEKSLAAGESIEFLKVSFSGAFIHPSEVAILTTYEGGPGFTIVTPFELDGGGVVLVDRGVVPENARDEIARPAGPQRLTGIVRMHEEGRAYFDVAHDQQTRTFYWWDLESIRKYADLPQAVGWLPFVLQQLPDTASNAFPQPAEPKTNLRNNHLGYAITWFGLAAVLVVMTGVYLRTLMKTSSA